jgi:hypothetical protein
MGRSLVLLCYKYGSIHSRLTGSGWWQQGQGDKRCSSPITSRARSVASEAGLCRTTRTGSAPRLETAG